jgi:subtilisin family serine protease
MQSRRSGDEFASELLEFQAMKKLSHAALLCSALILSFGFATAGAQESVSLSEAEFVGNLWFVELSGKPTADGNSLANVRAEKAAFKKAAASAGVSYTERRSFDTLFNGYSVEIDAANRARLTAVTGVKALWPVELIQMPPIETLAGGAAPDLATAIAMTGANIAQSSLGLTGAGVKVAIMDTGTDYNHPDLGGCFGPGCRVVTGYDFVGDAFNADPTSAAYNPTPAPDADPDDCNGHGTHVSGIVGANGGVVGVARGVTFGAYRVFGCAGSTTGDIMIAAMERALADGMQVLNMSIGSSFQWPQYPTAQAADRLVNKGMSVVASIGNSGANGLYSAGAPGLGKKVIGVASFDNTQVTQLAFTVSPDNLAIGFNLATAAPPPPTSGSLPMAKTGTPTTTNDGCAPLPAGSLAGMAVLIRRGTCGFNAKAFNAQSAGAAAVVLYNNVAGPLNPTVAGPPAITIPVVAISAADGAIINGRIAAGATTLTWTNQTVATPLATGGLISSFSSYGLSPDLALKPDIGAPGGSIFSTYPIELGRYASISGTSMASPHTAGAVALLLQARPNTSSQVVRSILQNSADPKNWSGNPGLGFLDHVHRQGAGMLDIDDAILATTKIEPGKIATGEGQAGPFTQALTIENNGSSAVTYDLSFVNALSTGGVITPTFFGSDASVAFSAPSVTVPAGGSATINATITPATGPANGQYGGYIVFTPQGGGQVYRVPFAGFVGDYQGIQVFTGGFPFLAKLNSCTPASLLRGLECFGAGVYGVFPAGASYNLTAAVGQTPYFLVHLEHQVRILRAEVFSTSGKAWHRIFNEDYVGRNSASNTFFAFPWDGTTAAGNKTYTVPNGQYVVKVSALKALGDESNPAHWETWTSPVITIARP